jgi:hypothetical protein
MAGDEALVGDAVDGLDTLLRRGDFEIAALGRYLDGLDSGTRIAQVRALGGKAQAVLYEAAKGARKLKLDQLVPSSVKDLTEVPHHGKNSLPLFTHFSKVFCRPRRDAKELWGFNRVGAVIEKSVGPGYYVAYEGPGDEVLIDYTRLPEGKLEHWPEMLSNKARLSRFVYADTIDALRAVSNHVTIGRAMRSGKVLDNWFALCRD